MPEPGEFGQGRRIVALSDFAKALGSYCETPFTIRHVEGHLVFGPLARRLPLASVLLGLGILGGIESLVRLVSLVALPLRQDIIEAVPVVPLTLVICWYFLRWMSRRQQAILGWLLTKFALGFLGFLLFTTAVPLSFFMGDSDPWPLLCLGVAWMPGLEFLPRITPYQRYVTLARLALSIPFLHFGR